MSSKSNKSKSSDMQSEQRKTTAQSGATAKKLNVTLQHGRSRYLGGAAFGLVAGVLCLWKLGTIGQVIGIGLLLMATVQALKAGRTFLHKPGRFQQSEDGIAFPTGLCTGSDLKLQQGDVQHAFFIRRTVPWTQAGPILVVEIADKAYNFPRDWFASDSDQIRVARALNQSIKSS